MPGTRGSWSQGGGRAPLLLFLTSGSFSVCPSTSSSGPAATLVALGRKRPASSFLARKRCRVGYVCIVSMAWGLGPLGTLITGAGWEGWARVLKPCPLQLAHGASLVFGTVLLSIDFLTWSNSQPLSAEPWPLLMADLGSPGKSRFCRVGFFLPGICGGLSEPGVTELVLGKGWLSLKVHL